jgi:hypothetical protein
MTDKGPRLDSDIGHRLGGSISRPHCRNSQGKFQTEKEVAVKQQADRAEGVLLSFWAGRNLVWIFLKKKEKSYLEHYCCCCCCYKKVYFSQNYHYVLHERLLWSLSELERPRWFVLFTYPTHTMRLPRRTMWEWDRPSV